MPYEIGQKWDKKKDGYRIVSFSDNLKNAEKEARGLSKKGNETVVVNEHSRKTVYKFKNGRKTYQPKEWGDTKTANQKRDKKGRFIKKKV